ncbi:hypothetical protein CMI45_00285 [Candidatus Pacearchaeota archaeon]|nr:hypothetical protein [Candidatus Pacearchaeota archaeon]|tara:strand:- start:1199 stop:1663 length:465 start_codon:yes stop_codon:yes gene_type:complete
MKSETLITGFLSTVILALIGVTGGLVVSNIGVREEKINSLENVGRQAMVASAGEDRIWSDDEKREFLDEIGLKHSILQEGQDIYLRVGTNRNYGIRQFSLPHVDKFGGEFDIIGGYNLENDGGLLVGSRTKSGTSLGKVSEKTMKSYIDKKLEQ